MSEVTTLLIDDEQMVLDVLSAFLRQKGIPHVCAKSADEGVLVLKDRPIDVIVTDVRMPGLSGLDLLTQVKFYWPATRRIILTGDTKIEAQADEILDSGLAHEILWKPCDAASIIAAIGAHRDQFEPIEEDFESETIF